MSTESWFKPKGVLDSVRYAALIADRESIVRDAGVPVPGRGTIERPSCRRLS